MAPRATPQNEETFTLVEGPDELGYFSAFSDKGYAHLHADGTPLYEERYDDIGRFQEGYAVVQMGEQSFHIKPNGTRAYNHVITGVVMPFERGRADVFSSEGNFTLVIGPSTGTIHLIEGSLASAQFMCARIPPGFTYPELITKPVESYTWRVHFSGQVGVQFCKLAVLFTDEPWQTIEECAKGVLGKPLEDGATNIRFVDVFGALENAPVAVRDKCIPANPPRPPGNFFRFE